MIQVQPNTNNTINKIRFLDGNLGGPRHIPDLAPGIIFAFKLNRSRLHCIRLPSDTLKKLAGANG